MSAGRGSLPSSLACCCSSCHEDCSRSIHGSCTPSPHRRPAWRRCPMRLAANDALTNSPFLRKAFASSASLHGATTKRSAPVPRRRRLPGNATAPRCRWRHSSPLGQRPAQPSLRISGRIPRIPNARRTRSHTHSPMPITKLIDEPCPEIQGAISASHPRVELNK